MTEKPTPSDKDPNDDLKKLHKIAMECASELNGQQLSINGMKVLATQDKFAGEDKTPLLEKLHAALRGHIRKRIDDLSEGSRKRFMLTLQGNLLLEQYIAAFEKQFGRNPTKEERAELNKIVIFALQEIAVVAKTAADIEAAEQSFELSDPNV